MRIRILLAGFLIASSAAAQKPCPSEPGVYVLNGSEWKALEGIHPDKIKFGKIAYTKSGIIAVFRDPESPARVETDAPVFCSVGIVKDQAALSLIALKIQGKERRTIVANVNAWFGYKGHQKYFDPETVVHLKIDVEGPSTFRFSPEERLHKGEYIVFTDVPDVIPGGTSKTFDPHLVKGYDFGYFIR